MRGRRSTATPRIPVPHGALASLFSPLVAERPLSVVFRPCSAGNALTFTRHCALGTVSA
jgi:hypothetical protein